MRRRRWSLATLAFAFMAGMVATVNPCGFAMLPAYVSMFVTGDGAHGAGTAARPSVVRGLRIGGWVAVGFVATFTVFGAVVRLASGRVIAWVPWVAVVVGVGLVTYGVAVLRGRSFGIRALGLRFGSGASARSAAGFGVAYGVGSLSCTLPVFLSVTTLALASANPAVGLATFSAYGVGMGVVLMALAVTVGASREALVRNLRRVSPFVERFGGWALVVSGGFVTYYWVTNLAVPVDGGDSVWYRPVLIVDRVSAWFTGTISDNGILLVAVLVAMVALIGAFELHRLRVRPATSDRQPAG